MPLLASKLKPRQSWFKWVWLLVALVLLALMLRRFEHSQVYHPDRSFRATGAELGRAFEDVYFRSTDGLKLNGWFFPADNNSSFSRLAVLVCHGNAGNIGDRLDVCSAFLSLGLNVLLFDYRGYGRSEGTPSETGTYLDGEAALKWLRSRGFSPDRVIIHGESLGGGVGAELAVREPVGGLILQSTFTSIPDIGAELFPFLPVRWLSRIKYDTRSKLPQVKAPVLVMHSRSDTLIRFHHAEKLFAAARDPKVFCELKGDHNNSLDDPMPFTRGVEKFLQSLSTANVGPIESQEPQPLTEANKDSKEEQTQNP